MSPTIRRRPPHQPKVHSAVLSSVPIRHKHANRRNDRDHIEDLGHQNAAVVVARVGTSLQY